MSQLTTIHFQISDIPLHTKRPSCMWIFALSRSETYRVKGPLYLRNKLHKKLTYLHATYSTAASEQRGSLTKVACPLLRLMTYFMNAVTEKLVSLIRYSCTNLFKKGANFQDSIARGSNIIRSVTITGISILSQHDGLRVAAHHDLHTKGTSKSSDSNPTLPNTFPKQSLFKFSHFLWSICKK